MRVKRLLTMLLALCMVVSVLSPAVSAVEPAKNSYPAAENSDTSTKVNASPFENDRVISSDDAAGSLNLRDDPIMKPEVEASENGAWTATRVDGLDASLTISETPKCIAELKEAAEMYKASDMVTAFVVMEDEPLAEVYSSINLVRKADEQALLEIQDAVIDLIEAQVMDGEELDVRYQFTYLTNAFSIFTEFGKLSEIAMMDGVKSVYLMPVYNPCTVQEGTASPHTASSGAMTGVAQVWNDLGYTGEGMKIAVIDTGLDLDHPSFAAAPATTEDSMTQADIDAVLKELNAYAKRSTITSKTLYRSAKVPFAFNYVDNNLTADHSADMQGDHGTHVAGIAAANALEGTSVVGMAPNAQIIVMKVFGAAGGAYTDDIVAALEDAMTLGCDVVNMSLGSSAGFTSTDTEIDLIYQRLAEQDIIATISAGNDGTSAYSNMWGNNINRTQNPDNAAVGQPGTYANATTIASADNAVVKTSYFTVADGTKVFYTDPYQFHWALSDLIAEEESTSAELEYVVIDGLGNYEDYFDADGNSLVAGKVAIVKRGEISFAAKIFNAQDAGAIACLVWNNTDEDIYNFGMQISEDGETFPDIPSALIMLADGDMMNAAETKTMVVHAEPGDRQNASSGQMSSFSSWGVAPDLSLEPDITGIGGNVYSCYDGGGYGLMSGTSMSAPQVAGVTALVMQYLHEQFPGANEGQIRVMANALMMSTADPIISAESGVEASPRQQGAGLVDAYESVTAGAYLTVDGDMPKAQLGDSASGNYTFSFEIHNFGTEAKTYTFDSSLLTEAAAGYQLSETAVEYFMSGTDMALSGSVSFNKESVTVAPGATATVTVSIALSDEDKAYFAEAWENGGYVEGYVYLNTTSDEGVVANELNLPFLGFYGDWTQAPAFDSAFWYHNSFWSAAPANGLPEGDEYWNVMWTDLGGVEWVLGFNLYTGAVADENGNIIYDPANNSLSPNGDGVMDSLADIYLSLMRNVKTLTITYTNADTGEVLSEEVIHNATKTMYLSGYGQVIPWLYGWYGSGMYDFTDANGEYLANNTNVLLTFDADIDYADGGEHTIEIPITVDTEAPQLKKDFQYTWDGNKLVILATDNVALADVFIMNNSCTQIWAEQPEFTEIMDGVYQIELDVTGLGTEFTVVLGDYAGNEGYYQLTYDNFFAGDNLPEVDTTKLYGYRTYDNYIYSDHMYGWISMNMPASAEEYANIAVHTDDYLEYAAINAAEYVDGKVFAVDAVYNLVMMVPGLWDRTTLCNLGVNVLDMTFDDSTDTMYVLTKNDYYVSLCTMDILTGELTELYDYGYYNYAPYAIADDDNGTLYAIQYAKANLFTLNEAYEMVAITDADGNNIVITDVNGSNVYPNYAQSLTYEDGILYWSYFTSSWRGESSCLICIDVETMTAQGNVYAASAYDGEGNVVEYYPTTEVLGLHTLSETDYQIPAAEALQSLWMEDEFLVLNVGDEYRMKANPIPWNYEITELQWSSSNEAVATVDSNGTVTAVAEGTAVITAVSGDVSVSCTVTVVDVDGNFYAYNYYSGDGNYGYMIDVDLSPIGYQLTAESPVDFIAGDYNGHDGYFYGYTEGGQLWRYDQTTGEAVKLGEPTGINPCDMAYDYSTGLMYMTAVDYTNYCSYIYQVNMNSGALMPVMEFYDFLMTLACDQDGMLYAISMYGDLYWIDMTTGEYDYAMSGLGDLQYMQSMCYDHVNDVILWAYPEASQIFWVDVKSENPYAISLGDPTGSGLLEFVGMYTIPETIPELAPVAVESVTAADMLLLAGMEKAPNVTVMPFNATVQTLAMTSSDETVVAVTDSGLLQGVGEGTATISYTLTDTVSGNAFEGTFDVKVLVPADDIYGHVLTDLATYGGQYWVRLYPVATNDPDILEATEYIIYAEEYYDGKLYAYGYDPNDWTGNWQLFIMDPVSHAVEKQLEMGEGFPFVYDMTYDYATSTMYALAGPSDNATDLYVVDLETGELILLMETPEFFMNIAATDDGLYVMEASQAESDEFDPWAPAEYTNATLYRIDPIAKTSEVIGDTGIKCNMLASMSYDYDTGYLYWTPMYQGSSYVSSLAIVDTATGAASALGTIGVSGAQTSGLYIISENFPEEPAPALNDLLVTPAKTSVTAGNTVTVNAYALPLTVDAQITWTSSDESIATVDENGVVTGVAQGKATITATATYGDVTKTASCDVAVLNADAAFLTYNATDGGWAAISRADGSVVTNLTSGEQTGVAAITAMNGTVYGYDDNNTLFTLDTTTYKRTEIGAADAQAHITDYLMMMGYTEDDVAAEIDYYAFEIRDLAYDPANERLLALGNVYDAEWGEVNYGNSIYEVDVKSGKLTLLHTFDDIYYVMAIAACEDGTIVHYNAYNDYYNKLDLTTGISTGIVTLQTQSYYGDYESDHTLYFDELTGLVYHLFTSNGSFYRMIAVDPASGALNVDSEFVGEVVYDEDTWSNVGDAFVGLAFVEMDVPTACDHSYESVTTKATCTEDGCIVYTCSICGHSYTEVIPATGHDHQITDSKEATCTEDGYVTYTCVSCDDTYTAIITAAHAYESVTVEATCTEDGSITYTCSICGDSYAEVIPATGHAYAVTETVEATCTESGSVTYTCGNCGHSYTETIEATGHNHVLVESKEATCEENGYEFYRCENCGDEYQIILEATGHNYVDGVCTNCGAEEETGSGWFDWFDKWFGSWWGDNEEETPSEPAPSEPAPGEPGTEAPSEPEEDEDHTPGWGSWFDWIFGGWWN